MNILVTGSDGQLGSEIKIIANNCSADNFIFKNSYELNICDFKKTKDFILNNNINAIINCAAYTDVDKAENDSSTAMNVNSNGVINLIKSLTANNGRLIHISTDYVFDGNTNIAYKESDPVNPIGVYGKTKRSGELEVLNSHLDAIVIRTSWLYSSYGNNFLNKLLRISKNSQSLNIISDQFGTPTYAKNLAKTCVDIISNYHYDRMDSNGKLYHYSNEGSASWFDFAIAIKQMANLDIKINQIDTKNYASEVERPMFSVLDKSKIKKVFDIKISYWKDSLKDCIDKIKNSL